VISAGKRSELRVLTTAGVSLQMQQAYAGLAHPHASRQARVVIMAAVLAIAGHWSPSNPKIGPDVGARVSGP
jgi:hypothetical protein